MYILNDNFSISKDNLGGIFSGSGRYLVPDYQRPYIWNEDEVEELWTDLMADYSNENTEDEEYLLGSFVVISRNRGSLYEIVDGQQRLVTLTLMLCAIRDTIRDYKGKSNTDEWSIDNMINKIDKRITKGNEVLITLNDNGANDVLRSIQKNELGDFKIEKSTRKPVKSLVKNYNQLLVAAKTLCKSCNLDSPNINFRDSISTIDSILDNVCLKTSFVSVNIHNDAYAHQIFQSLNSKGIPLNQADLIKSHLLKMNKSIENKINDRWSKLMSKFGKKPDDFLYESLLSRPVPDVKDIQKNKLYSHIKKRCVDNASVINYIKELEEDADIIELLANPDCIPVGHPSYLKHSFYGIKQIRAIHIRRPIIAACRIWKYNNNKTELLVDCLLKFFFMYRTICKKDVDALKKISRDVTRQIIDNKDMSAIFWTILKNSSTKIVNNNVDEEEFTKKFGEKTYDFTTNEIKYILISYERYLQEFGGVEIGSLSELELEHIFPKTPNDEWKNRDELKEHLNRLGNITLINGKWNPPLGNYGFEKKNIGTEDKPDKCYKKSALKLNVQYLSDYAKWSVTEIEDREKRLCNLVTKVWNLTKYVEKAKKPEGTAKQ